MSTSLFAHDGSNSTLLKRRRRNRQVFFLQIFLMGDEKSEIVMASRDRERDRELLIPVADSPDLDIASKPSSSSSSSASSSHHSGRETFYKFVRSWASKKFMTGWCATLFSISFISLIS
ncbi:hypothetical protein DKX38_028203 [Salix brachista]|uniref:Uncharacterized protein n=1 Tax=Salix brachista TaxID=2182728 RepID=A0A5N5JGQ4_9ROSI|nr:hypothetical protein DKX38_028203 [Salix brachista]